MCNGIFISIQKSQNIFFIFKLGFKYTIQWLSFFFFFAFFFKNILFVRESEREREHVHKEQAEQAEGEASC